MADQTILLLLACLAALGCGTSAALLVARKVRMRKTRDSLYRTLHVKADETQDTTDAVRLFMALARRQTQEAAAAGASAVAPDQRNAHTKVETALARAGYAHIVSAEGFRRARVITGIGGVLIGALLGAMATIELASVLAVVGTAVGIVFPKRALKALTEQRKHELERHLSEMLEVTCLGLRSGLSFDAALQLYCREFDSILAAELAVAQRRWEMGLLSREESLREVAATYDSALFSRVVDNVVRSLRFGSSMAEGLDTIASEARQLHKALVEERVMKAPVKMMVPVGTLILPSMLLLVMGPVLLELMEGF